jgi:hypothetical protein
VKIGRTQSTCGKPWEEVHLWEQLNATISPGLWRALLDYAEGAQEPLGYIV